VVDSKKPTKGRQYPNSPVQIAIGKSNFACLENLGIPAGWEYRREVDKKINKKKIVITTLIIFIFISLLCISF
jgi:hypothetical protein